MKEILFNLSSKFRSRAIEKGLSDLEFYGIWSREIHIEISRSRVKSVVDKTSINYGIIGAIGKKIGSIGLRDLDINVDRILDRLISIIKASREDEKFAGFAKKYGRGVESSIFDKKIVEIDHSEALDIINNAIETSIESARKHGADETFVTEGSFELSVGGVYISNIDGEEQYREGTLNNMFLEIKSRKDGEESSYWAIYQSRRLSINDILREANRGGEYSIKFIKASNIESGEYSVILDPYMTAAFISSALSPAFSALSVQENRSPLKNKIETQILSENIDIVDDPAIDWSIGSRSFDDEGIATMKKNIVEKGVLKTYLYNYYTAKRENRESTGNGIRQTPSSITTPGFTNFVLKGRGLLMNFDEMISELKKGIIVHGLIGYWMSNPVNGSTQATISHGLLVEHGEVKKAVKGNVLVGNIYEWLGRNIQGIGREVINVYGIMHVPAIFFSNGRIG
ncbi:MAG: metallopeptidase TldD-related protein [Desulfurococcaceae archaeon]